MGPVAGARTAVLVRLGELTNRTYVLPMLIFFPTSRCNSRCVSCDWWRHSGSTDLTASEIRELAAGLPALGTRLVLFSGGEPLLRSDIFEIARVFRRTGATLHLLTSGVLLERCATEVGREFGRVVVSLDGATAESYAAVRGISGLAALERGVARLRRLSPVPVTARATLHARNFRELPQLIDRARTMGLDHVSFLAADVASDAFGGPRPHAAALALSAPEVAEFVEVVERTLVSHRADFDSGFVSERPEKLRRLPRYYAALAGLAPFPPVSCNAPWTSVVVEADGAVRPCFFHAAIGSVRERPLAEIVAGALPAFRRRLDMATDPHCTRCVCALKTTARRAPWL